MFFLDSSVCVPILRNSTNIDHLPSPEKTNIPIIVAAELWTGVKKSGRTHQAARLQAFLDLFEIVEFGIDAALHYADIRTSLEAAGTPIGPLDMLIAAQARCVGATLVTLNNSEFSRVKDLKLFRWNREQEF